MKRPPKAQNKKQMMTNHHCFRNEKLKNKVKIIKDITVRIQMLNSNILNLVFSISHQAFHVIH